MKGIMSTFTGLAAIALVIGLSGCGDVEPKPDTGSCADTAPATCGCPGNTYPSTECVDGEWFCPGPNSCPGNENITTVNNTAVNNTTPCRVESTSDLAGVALEIEPSACVFTQTELADGVEFAYSYTIDSLTDISPAAEFSCWRDLDGNFPHTHEIVGNGQRFCLCDVGLCDENTSLMTLIPGTYRKVFGWTGTNWNGPSDTGNPLGEPFPPGTYTVTVRSSGSDAEGTPFEVTSSLVITVVE